MSKSINPKSNLKNTPSQWVQLMGEIVDKLVGTNTSTTMKFLIDPAVQLR